MRRAHADAAEAPVNTPPFKPKAYLREGCPFSFKLLLFLAESGMASQVEIIRCNPGTAEFATIKSRLEAGLHKSVTFPTAEIEPGRYLCDSDALIEHFAAQRGVDVRRLPAFSFYLQTIFPQLLRLHQG